MKQHITVEQLRELTPEARKTFVEWFESKNWFPHYDGAYMMLEGFDETLANCCGIGQMIELLGENMKEDPMGYIDESYDNVIYLGDSGHNNKLSVGWNGEELCDALWEAGKDILER